MSAPWVNKQGRATMVIDRDALSAALGQFAPDLNAVAAEVANEAKAILPTENMRKFIGFLPAGPGPGTWTLKLRGRHYGSGTGDRLGRGLNVPIALVTNDSNLATIWEYGGTPQEVSHVVRRPGHKAGETKTGDSMEQMSGQWQPLTLAAQKVGARLVLKRRESRSG
jgi:hypothetical protein